MREMHEGKLSLLQSAEEVALLDVPEDHKVVCFGRNEKAMLIDVPEGQYGVLGEDMTGEGIAFPIVLLVVDEEALASVLRMSPEHLTCIVDKAVAFERGPLS